MSVQDLSSIVGTAAPAYAQVRQMKDQRKQSQQQNELARAQLASEMSIADKKLQYQAGEDNKKREYERVKDFESEFYSPNNILDDDQRAERMRNAPAGVFPAPPVVPFPWQGQEPMGDATQGPALNRLAEAFSPELKYPALARQPEAIRAANKGKNADADFTKAKTETDNAARPGVVADAGVKVATADNRVIEQYLMNKVKEGDITLAQAQTELAKLNAGKVKAETDTEIEMRGPTVDKATADARTAGVEADFAQRNQEYGLRGKLAGALRDESNARLTDKITGPTARKIEADVANRNAQTGQIKEQTKYIGFNAQTQRMNAQAQQASNRISKLRVDLEREQFNFSKPLQIANLNKINEELRNLQSNNAVPDALKAEVSALEKTMSAFASSIGVNPNPAANAAMSDANTKLKKLMTALPIITNAPSYGMPANLAYGISKALERGEDINQLKAAYNAQAVGKKTPKEIETTLRAFDSFNAEFKKAFGTAPAAGATPGFSP